MACNHCEEFGRAQLFRRAAAEAGNGLPLDRARDADPGRNRDQPAQLRAALERRDALRLRRLEAPPRRSADRDRRGRRRQRQGPRLGLPRRWCRLALGAGPDHRPAPTSRCARASPWPPGAGDRVHRGQPPALAPARRRSRSAPSAPARSACCPRSATTRPISRTSPRATTGRSASSMRTSAPAGSAACST